jgi:hypothetical protein
MVFALQVLVEACLGVEALQVYLARCSCRCRLEIRSLAMGVWFVQTAMLVRLQSKLVGL